MKHHYNIITLIVVSSVSDNVSYSLNFGPGELVDSVNSFMVC